MFLPSFAFIAIVFPLIPRLKKTPGARVFLDAINAVTMGLMAAVSWQLARGGILDAFTAVEAIVALLILRRFQINSAWLILGGLVAGFAWKFATSSSSHREHVAVGRIRNRNPFAIRKLEMAETAGVIEILIAHSRLEIAGRCGRGDTDWLSNGSGMALRPGESVTCVLRKGPAGLSLTATTHVNALVTTCQGKKLRFGGVPWRFSWETGAPGRRALWFYPAFSLCLSA
jgi:hypothetical protein